VKWNTNNITDDLITSDQETLVRCAYVHDSFNGYDIGDGVGGVVE